MTSTTYTYATQSFIAFHTAAVPFNASEECPICRETYDPQNEECVRITGISGCSHTFGVDCLKLFLESNPEAPKMCPICRTLWLPGERDENRTHLTYEEMADHINRQIINREAIDLRASAVLQQERDVARLVRGVWRREQAMKARNTALAAREKAMAAREAWLQAQEKRIQYLAGLFVGQYDEVARILEKEIAGMQAAHVSSSRANYSLLN
ncbi:hypothetical protein C7974DRAFT_456486 [Boeremia exigua]|uniref:uncharacterized protein n=1 Tax=Boeremia exigua TaxID=749465 RepID=UPI001E8E02D1|nr:uncharacterized protein C7974DRAFT_456486 [Boeremia exigua]KAH6621786.1 hypothetical protein C7974DRAFT_456486 [Boeremia exigua]